LTICCHGSNACVLQKPLRMSSNFIHRLLSGLFSTAGHDESLHSVVFLAHDGEGPRMNFPTQRHFRLQCSCTQSFSPPSLAYFCALCVAPMIQILAAYTRCISEVLNFRNQTIRGKATLLSAAAITMQINHSKITMPAQATSDRHAGEARQGSQLSVNSCSAQRRLS